MYTCCVLSILYDVCVLSIYICRSLIFRILWNRPHKIQEMAFQWLQIKISRAFGVRIVHPCSGYPSFQIPGYVPASGWELNPQSRVPAGSEVAGWIPNRRPALELHFLQLVPRLSLKMYIYPTLEFSTPYFNFHLTDNECTCQLLLWAEVLQSWTKLLGH